ncbi:MAG: penicillin-binding protein activator [Deltaproteobacteria bacterium]|nr:penicillin-binding protein activator [Deltaproteobacteria bacterium]
MKKTFIYSMLFSSLILLSACADFPEKGAWQGRGGAGSLRRPSALQISEPTALWRKQIEQLERLGDYSGAVRVLRERYLRSPDPAVAELYSRLLTKLDEGELHDWWRMESEKGLACRLAAEYFLRLEQRPANRMTSADRRVLFELAERLGSACVELIDDEVRSAAQDYLLRAQVDGGSAMLTVGCLLPLSGSNAVAGQRLLRGMELALSVYPENSPSAASLPLTGVPSRKENTVSGTTQSCAGLSAAARSGLPEEVRSLSEALPRMRLLLYDTAGESERARAGVRYLVEEKGVSLLLGPYTGKAANYAAVEAQSLGVTMVGLSPLLRDLERYPNVFLHYPTIRNQAQALVEVAMSRLGIKAFAVLAPRNPYGRTFAEVFSDRVGVWGGEVVRQVFYDAGCPDFGPAIRELIGNEVYRRFKEKRSEYEVWLKERKAEIKDLETEGPASDQLLGLAREIGLLEDELALFDEKPEIMPRPLLACDFEAIVIPDRDQTLKLLIPQLSFYDLEEMFLLGGRYWNSAELLATVAEYGEGAIFVDAFFADRQGETADLGSFLESFVALYPEETPGLLEVLGYDTIMLLRCLASDLDDGQPDAESWRQLLASCRDLPLLSGLTTTTNDGELAKKLYPLTFRHGKIELFGVACPSGK